MVATFSADGKEVAFGREHDLWLRDLEIGVGRPLTTDGSEPIINGTTDWVYEEELSLRDAFRWSPDGTRIAYWRLDQSPIRTFHLVDQTSLYPELIPIRYPKAGTDNSRVRVGSLELATGETTWFDLGPEEDIYIPRMEWAASSDEVVIQRMNRHQNRVELLLGDARTGETRPILVETDEGLQVDEAATEERRTG
jgi:dipeptidyl-peptidase-4